MDSDPALLFTIACARDNAFSLHVCQIPSPATVLLIQQYGMCIYFNQNQRQSAISEWTDAVSLSPISLTLCLPKVVVPKSKAGHGQEAEVTQTHPLWTLFFQSYFPLAPSPLLCKRADHLFCDMWRFTEATRQLLSENIPRKSYKQNYYLPLVLTTSYSAGICYLLWENPCCPPRSQLFGTIRNPK